MHIHYYNGLRILSAGPGAATLSPATQAILGAMADARRDTALLAAGQHERPSASASQAQASRTHHTATTIIPTRTVDNNTRTSNTATTAAVTTPATMSAVDRARDLLITHCLPRAVVDGDAYELIDGRITLIGRTSASNTVAPVAATTIIPTLRSGEDLTLAERTVTIVKASTKLGFLFCQLVVDFAEPSREYLIVSKDGHDLRELDASFRDNRVIVLAAVQKDAYSLQHANERFRSDRGVVLAAIRQNHTARMLADASLQNDSEIVQAAELSYLEQEHSRAARNATDLKSCRDRRGAARRRDQYATQIGAIKANINKKGE